MSDYSPEHAGSLTQAELLDVLSSRREAVWEAQAEVDAMMVERPASRLALAAARREVMYRRHQLRNGLIGLDLIGREITFSQGVSTGTIRTRSLGVSYLSAHQVELAGVSGGTIRDVDIEAKDIVSLDVGTKAGISPPRLPHIHKVQVSEATDFVIGEAVPFEKGFVVPSFLRFE